MPTVDPRDIDPSVTTFVPSARVSAPVSTFMMNGPITTDLNNPSDKDPTEGRKFDGGKLEYGLLPPKALQATVEVLTIGAEKYARDNWKYVDDSLRRYFDALQRHIWAWKQGETFDPETGKHHLAHAMCCLMFLYEHDTIYSVDKK
jgi:hypothetical protein